MNDFNNLHQAKPDPVSLNSAPTYRYMWVCETTQNLAPPSNYVTNGYQQQAQPMYPFNVLHNSPMPATQHNFNQGPRSFPENFQTQHGFWAPNNSMFQSAPNLASPVTVTGYVVANPQFLQNSAGNQGGKIMTNTVDLSNQAFSAANVTSQPVSFGLVNSGYQPEQIWLQQHGQLLQNNLQQQDHLLQTNLQQQDRLLQTNIQQQQLQTNLQQQDQQLQTNLQQQDQLLQNSHDHQNHQQQEQTEDSISLPSQKHVNENLTYQVTKHSSAQNLNVKDDNKCVTENISDKIQESVKEAEWQEASSGTFIRDSFDPRPKALSSYFPTTLNPSLQIKSPSRLREPIALTKSGDSETISGPSFTLDETKIKGQDDFNESEVQFRRNNSHKSLVKEVYQKPRNKDDCIRCNTKVYPMERTGPIKDAFYHKRCFTCVTCGTTLNLKNFHHNPNEADDPSIFCASHRPKEKAHSCDANAMHIKSALTTPKLDMINGQIRTDRHPSEVLARSGYNPPSASGQNTAKEYFYYGMEARENLIFDASQKSYPQEHQGKEQLEHVEDLYQHSQQQVTEQQQYPREEQVQQLLNLEQTAHNQQHQLQKLLEQNIQLQGGILENDEKRTDDVANITISESNTTSMELTDNQADDVFLSNAPNKIHSTENNNGDKELSISSSLLSSSRRQENTTEIELESNLASHLTLDNEKALQKQMQDMRNKDEEKKLITREYFSSQSSISTSTRSISPMQVQTSFSFSENEDGRNSSSSSDLSSRERSSFSSDLSSPGSNSSSDLSTRERSELATKARPYSADQLTMFIDGVRVDRPSIHQYYHDLNKHGKTGSTDKMAAKTMSNYSLLVSSNNSDLDRFLPKNERMRLDRPSQH